MPKPTTEELLKSAEQLLKQSEDLLARLRQFIEECKRATKGK